MNLAKRIDAEILPYIQKPSRYINSEYNAVHKQPADVDVRMALIFPDLYDLGLGNLGLHILYDLINAQPWSWAERVYAPPADMEALLRERSIPLFTLESKTALTELDILGFSLQSELTYTSILNMIDLAGLPLRAENRAESGPLICAGGPCAFNPEPLAPFLDFFVIGDGEDVILEILAIVRKHKAHGRSAVLQALSAIQGVYVPSIHAAHHAVITRRVVTQLDTAPFPTHHLVPFAQQVHDRVALEIMRGCTRGCRFCHAGMTTRPVRERSQDVIDQLARKSIAATGYEELSLLSLSTCDYTHIAPLLSHAADWALDKTLSVSLPSLRLDSVSVAMADSITGARRGGLTFAPEAATPRLRSVINKPLEDDHLIEVCCEAFRRGWDHVKLYFMIGLPTETDEDVAAIVDLCLRVLAEGRKVSRRVKVATGVSTFVPKPFTPFQWAEQISLEETIRRQQIIKDGFGRNPNIKFGRHEPEASFVEGLLARGNRDTADLLEAAFQRGARLETSSEFLKLSIWQEAIADTNYDVAAMFAERDTATRLPWDYIDSLVSPDWLKDQWRLAKEGQFTPDCRRDACSRCGVNTRIPEACAAIRQRAAEVPEGIAPPPPIDNTDHVPEDNTPDKSLEKPERTAVQRLRFRIGRRGPVRFLSHLEFANAWIRALRRAEMPLVFSQGFHAHPKVQFSAAMPVGEESTGEYMDIVLYEVVAPEDAETRVRPRLSKGFEIHAVQEAPLNAPSLMSAVTGSHYSVFVEAITPELREAVERVMAMDSIVVSRPSKTPGKPPLELNVRPMILDMRLHEENGEATVDFTTCVLDGKTVKPREVLGLLNLPEYEVRVLRRETFLSELPV